MYLHVQELSFINVLKDIPSICEQQSFFIIRNDLNLYRNPKFDKQDSILNKNDHPEFRRNCLLNYRLFQFIRLLNHQKLKDIHGILEVNHQDCITGSYQSSFFLYENKKLCYHSWSTPRPQYHISWNWKTILYWR